jgi:hypothetical protein
VKDRDPTNNFQEVEENMEEPKSAATYKKSSSLLEKYYTKKIQR